MKLHEIIELNGKEYTVELNRESIVRIEQYTNLEEAQKKMMADPLRDKSNNEIVEGENPFAESIDEDAIEKYNKEKEEVIRTAFYKAFWIWLYPVEKLEYNQVKEIINPYFENEEKAEKISELYASLSEKSVEVRKQHLEELKNLKALTK